MVENLKIGCTVSKDQLSRAPIEGLELKTWEELDVMKGLLGSIGDFATWRGAIENG